MELDKAGSSVFANIPMEVLIPFMVNYVIQVADDLHVILAPVVEWWEANRTEIEHLAQLLDHMGAPT